MKHKKKTLFIATALVMLVLLLFPVNREFHILRERQGRVVVPDSIKELIIENTHSLDAHKTALYCSKVTCDLLKFSFQQDVLFENKVSKAHCVAYARLHATLCNIAYGAHNIDAKATPVVGYAELNFVNVNKLCVALVSPKYERYFKDHDAVEIRCKSNGKTLWIIDPTERDFIPWGGVYKRE